MNVVRQHPPEGGGERNGFAAKRPRAERVPPPPRGGVAVHHVQELVLLVRHGRSRLVGCVKRTSAWRRQAQGAFHAPYVIRTAIRLRPSRPGTPPNRPAPARSRRPASCSTGSTPRS